MFLHGRPSVFFVGKSENSRTNGSENWGRPAVGQVRRAGKEARQCMPRRADDKNRQSEKVVFSLMRAGAYAGAPQSDKKRSFSSKTAVLTPFGGKARRKNRGEGRRDRKMPAPPEAPEGRAKKSRNRENYRARRSKIFPSRSFQRSSPPSNRA